MIVMTVSGERPDYLAETLASWAAVRGADDQTVGVALEPGAHRGRCAAVVAEFAAARAGTTLVRRNEHRLGVLANPHRALSWAFAERAAPFAILAEEDIVVGDDVLELFTSQAAAHAGAADVLGICAFSRLPAPQPDDVVGTGHFSPWVWGTWADRWHGDLAGSWFAAARAPRPGDGEGFDFGLVRTASATGRRFVVPLASRSDNIGRYGGVHARPEDFAASRAATFAAHREPVTFREIDADHDEGVRPGSRRHRRR